MKISIKKFKAWRKWKTLRLKKFLTKYKYFKYELRLTLAKIRLQQEIIVINNRNSKYLFNYIRSKIGVKDSLPLIIETSTSILNNDFAIAEEFNRFFASVYNKSSHHSYSWHDCNPIQISFECVSQILSSLSESSTGPDEIPVSLLKGIKFIMSPVLVNLFERSLNNGYIPIQFKLAKITPIY